MAVRQGRDDDHDRAIIQDAEDLVERMNIVHKDKPLDALTVLANALGMMLAHTKHPCPECDRISDCPSAIMFAATGMNQVVVLTALAEMHHTRRASE